MCCILHTHAPHSSLLWIHYTNFLCADFCLLRTSLLISFVVSQRKSENTIPTVYCEHSTHTHAHRSRPFSWFCERMINPTRKPFALVFILPGRFVKQNVRCCRNACVCECVSTRPHSHLQVSDPNVRVCANLRKSE